MNERIVDDKEVGVVLAGVGTEITPVGWLTRYRAILAGVVVILAISTGIVVFLKDEGTDTTPVVSQPPTVLNAEAASAVVNVYCGESGGSGTIISSDGLVLTNSHVIPQARGSVVVGESGCLVILPDPNTGEPVAAYYATPLVITDSSEKFDIAFLRITGAYKDPTTGIASGVYPRKFPYNACIRTDARLGERVYVYGYPSITGGERLTITEGIISSLPLEGILSTTAQVAHGNSGGLAADVNGCMVGIPTFRLADKSDSANFLVAGDKILELHQQIDSGVAVLMPVKGTSTIISLPQSDSTSQAPRTATTTPIPQPATPTDFGDGDLPGYALTGHVVLAKSPSDKSGGRVVFDPAYGCSKSEYFDGSIGLSGVSITISNASFRRTVRITECFSSAAYRISGIPYGIYNVAINLPSGYRLVGYSRTGQNYQNTSPTIQIGEDGFTEVTNWFFIYPN